MKIIIDNCLFCNKSLFSLNIDYLYCNNRKCEYICRVYGDILELEKNDLCLTYSFLTNKIEISFEYSLKGEYFLDSSLEDLKQIFLNYESNLIFM